MDRTRLRFWGRVVAWPASLVLIGLWIIKPERGPWDALLALVALATAVGNETVNKLKPGPGERFLSNGERARHRVSMLKVLQEEIQRLKTEDLRQDVIVRDVDRMDTYPETSDAPGISPWFRLGLLQTYHRGIVVALGIGGLKRCEGGYRFNDWINNEASDETVFLLGDIPFDSIAEVNLDGDEYYSFPHIYCHFDADGQPYERLWFGRKVCREPSGNYEYEHVAEYNDVVGNNPPDGTLHFA